MFKKINLMDTSVKILSNEFSKAINSNKEFAITPTGEIKYAPFEKEVFIYKGKVNTGLLNQQNNFRKILGENYRVKASFTHVEVSVDSAWEEMKEINTIISLYEDSSSEGIDSFSDKNLEEISFHAIEFKISNREIAEIIESSVDGVLLCLEREIGEHYSFNGIGFIFGEIELMKARVAVFDKVKELIFEHIKNNKEEFIKYGFSEEQQEALDFFNLQIVFE